MKSGSSTKKMMLVMTVVLCALVLSGCKVPTDATGAVKQITMDTSFQEIMSSENWFSAILVWPMAWLINSLTPPAILLVDTTSSVDSWSSQQASNMRSTPGATAP